MSFPPAKGSSQITNLPGDSVKGCPPTSTGSGGLKSSVPMKNAGIKPSPGIEKVNSAS